MHVRVHVRVRVHFRVQCVQGGHVLFPGRGFAVEGGVVCASRWASPEVRQALLDAAKR